MSRLRSLAVIILLVMVVIGVRWYLIERQWATLWSYAEIDATLKCDSKRIVREAVAHLEVLMRKAQDLAKQNRTVYGTLQSPLLGFFIPKTGSNTQEYYHLEALAAIRQASYAGCPGPDMYGCLKGEPNTCKATSFGNHFEPVTLVQELLQSNCTNDSRGWPKSLFSSSASTTRLASSLRAVLHNHSVCTIVFRNPVERLISGFYEWHYNKTTNDNAIEHWKRVGADNFPQVMTQSYFIGMNNPGEPIEKYHVQALEAVMTGCIVGVTEELTDYVTTLSRVLWVKPPGSSSGDASSASALRVRSKKRHGMQAVGGDRTTAALHQRFHAELEALVLQDVAIWQLARHVARAQVKAASRRAVYRLLPDPLVPQVQRRGIDANCDGCARCTPPGWDRFRWTSYSAAEACVGPTITGTDGSHCCVHAPD
jgi:hypothetical protein